MSTNTDLIKFDELKANIAQYVSPVFRMTVTDPATATDMIEAGKLIAKYKKAVEDQRKALVSPLNDQVKVINTYAGTLSDPLAQAEAHAKTQLIAFERKLEAERQIAAKAESERREKAEAEARAEQERAAAKLAEKHRAQLASIEPSESENPLGSDDEADLAAEHARETAEAQAKADREAAVRAAEAKQRQHDIDSAKVKNSAKTWKCELIDIEKVPAHFVTKTLNTSMVIAAARGGTTDIPGVKLWQDTSIRFGANTSMGSLAQKG